MNKKALIVSISVMVAIFFISSLTTQTNAYMEERSFEGVCRHDMSRGGEEPFLSGADGFRQLGRYMDLSIEQRQKLHKIRFDLMKKTIDLQDELGQKR